MDTRGEKKNGLQPDHEPLARHTGLWKTDRYDDVFWSNVIFIDPIPRVLPKSEDRAIILHPSRSTIYGPELLRRARCLGKMWTTKLVSATFVPIVIT